MVHSNSPSAADYAIQQKLTTNAHHVTFHGPQFDELGYSLDVTDPNSEQAFLDAPHLPSFDIPYVEFPTEEITNPNGAQDASVSNALGDLPDDIVLGLIDAVCKYRSTRALKLEVPALRSDSGMDLRRFIREVERGRPMNQEILSQYRLPMEPARDDEDGGLGFPEYVILIGDVYYDDIKTEQLADSGTDAAATIRDALTLECDAKDRKDILDMELARGYVSGAATKVASRD